MSDTLFALVPIYGVWLLFGVTFLSCLALPVPSSLMMLAGGGFAASGDLALGSAALSAYVGAVAGDQTGYAIGRKGGGPLIARLSRRTNGRAALRKAQVLVDRRGGVAVFLTRWLLSPLGPYVNFIGGAVGLAWSRFTVGSVLGEACWVALYVGLGFAFASHIAVIADIAGNLSGLLAALAVLGVSGTLLFRKHRNGQAHLPE